MINEDTQCQPLASTYMYIHTCVHMHTQIYNIHMLPQNYYYKGILLFLLMAYLLKNYS